jgi:hypothetical protein
VIRCEVGRRGQSRLSYFRFQILVQRDAINKDAINYMPVKITCVLSEEMGNTPALSRHYPSSHGQALGIP